MLYVVLDDDSTIVHNNQVKKSKVVAKTLNPVFNETLEYNLQGLDFKGTKGLRIEVWDRDYFSKDEPLGQVTLPWEAIEVELDVGPREYPVLPRPLKDESGNDFAERFGGSLTLSWTIK